ncbi:hypothetical protein A2Y83_02470 [Candidatus Falkowbacteria bacterium RBG_13_39_14]|uniref:histidine kinase n=1 Tax=Candidatus Falkowbacteria bacterium RBG_13_39_14 TaxID=1797985 RepID=A0A1F5S841_9BACT|nr:MAG: hypothetical protein A2Y83_02470 [Candidatus Falkowbacteria bacterium RBG_13_39_14]
MSAIVGIFVFIKNKKSLLNKLLLFSLLSFSLWSIVDIMLWMLSDSTMMMFFWSLIIFIEASIYVGCLYLTYVFIKEKDLTLNLKFLLIFPILPILFLIPTKFNLKSFDLAGCQSVEGLIAIEYVYAFEGIVFLAIILFSIFSYRAEKHSAKRRKIALFAAGIVLFLIAFSWGNIIGSVTLNWSIEQYGLFGMPIFVVFLAYLIVKYEAFDTKLLATQALIVALILLIGSLFLVQDIFTIRIITSITLTLTIIAGWQLIRSVKLEVQRKEELEKLSAQLAGANDKLHQLDKAKSEFISIASHQLRTPLTSIKGFGSLLLEGTYGPLPDAQRKSLEKIYISNERLIQLVEDLLNISRMEAGRMEFDFQEAQIEGLIQEAVDTLELSAKAKNLYLHWQKPAVALPMVKIDITKIKEVISNMVDNAIKYTQKGGVTVRVEKGSFFDHNTREQKNIIRISVSDTGIGMDKEELEGIFNKFERGKDVSHYHTDGTGLGMYVGKKMVEAHHGRIWAESPGKGKGSRFILELPIG